jgi:release factor glutamine methyltransferase
VNDVAPQSHTCGEPPLTVGRVPVLAKLAGWLLTLGNRLLGNTRYDDFRLERICGVPIMVTPSVFNPKLLRTGEFFASQIDSALVGVDSEVLDMGTGTGVCAVFAAKHARRVVAVDINPAAAHCARINALLNRQEHKIDVRHGDLFEAVRHERFDLILFNPPFVLGTPRDDRDRAWRSNDVAGRFAADLHAHLKPGGCALVLLSTYGDGGAFLLEFHKKAFIVSVLARRQFVNERVTIFKLQMPACPT